MPPNRKTKQIRVPLETAVIIEAYAKKECRTVSQQTAVMIASYDQAHCGAENSTAEDPAEMR